MATLVLDRYRYYLDANVWSLLLSHPHRERVIANISVPEKRCAVPSIVNAAELLRTRDEPKRAALCGLMAATMTPGVVLLPHPTVVLERAVANFRRGDPSVTIPEDDETRTLRLLIEDPSLLDKKRKDELDTWAATEKRTQDEVWQYVTTTSTPLQPLADDFLQADELVMVLADYSMVKRLALTPAEVRDLLRGNAAWAAFALTLGVAHEMFNHVKYSKGKAKDLPNGPDHLQLTYLPLVSEFVTDDAAFFKTALRASRILRRTRGVTTEVRYAPDFFRHVGFPHPERR